MTTSDPQVADLCVLGSGPAGMMVALEYARRNGHRRVVLVEYGGLHEAARNGLDDRVRNLNPQNHHDPYECTNKVLGGTSLTWGGRCVMYDEVDFVDRPVLRGGCTWDAELLREVRTWVPTACEYFECGRPVFNLRECGNGQVRPIADGFQEGDVLDTPLERWSVPTRFGSRYWRDLERLGNVTVLPEHEAREFSRPDGVGAVASVSLRHVRKGTLQTVRARHLVIAAGAQESTRLLLRNPQVFECRGAVPDALGRYYQGHVSGKIASVSFLGDPRKTDYDFGRDPDGCFYRRRFQLSRDAIVRENLLNAALWLDNPLYHDPAHGNGAMSMMYLAMITPGLGRRLAPPAIARAVTKGRVNAVGRHLANVVRGLPGSLAIPASIFVRRYCLRRKLPGIFLYSRSNRYALHFHAEQVPMAESRMSLEPDGETLRMDYRVSDADIESVIRTHEILDRELRRSRCGRLELWWPRQELPGAIREMSRDGIHQCGTTRIAADPQHGVVDRDLRVWGTRNVYVCSSSAFPTSGQANPTLLLGAFAVRLARQLEALDADR